MEKKRFFHIFIIGVIFLFAGISLKAHVLQGYVLGPDSLAVENANVMVSPGRNGTFTDKQGFFKLSLDEGSYIVVISHIAYQNKSLHIQLTSDRKLTVYLPAKNMDQEVIIRGYRSDHNIRSSDIGLVEIQTKDIASLPVLFGEVEPLKSIALQPGIRTVSEGNTGVVVRGGGPGQNLMLYDNTPVYNPAHLAGFFSVFNPDAVDKTSVYKSGIPAYYGGRLSSVIMVNSDEGNRDSLAGKAGIGLISSKLHLSGPLSKKGSFSFSARRSYFDLLKPFFRDFFSAQSVGIRITDYFFYDINGSLRYQMSPKDRIKLSFYHGSDQYLYRYSKNDRTDVRWGNSLAKLKWLHIFNEHAWLENHVFLTNYAFDFLTVQNIYEFNLNSGVFDYGGKSVLNVLLGKNKIKLGGEVIRHRFSPTQMDAVVEGFELDFMELGDLYSDEMAWFVHDEFSVFDRWKINAGLRYSYYRHIGPFERFEKEEAGLIRDTISYSPGETIRDFHILEPRLSLRYLLNPRSSVKASFSKNNQSVHLATMPSVSMPTDMWLPSSAFIKPAEAFHYSVGYYRNFKQDLIESSIEVYYKEMDHLVEFKRGLLNSAFAQTLYDDIVQGKGHSYGMELFVQKTRGRLSGWLGYTLSRTERLFDELNNGNPYVSTYDRTHDLSLVAAYQLNEYWRLGATFVWSTGKAITLPENIYVVQEQLISEYGPRNGYRLPDYHRMDLSATYTRKKRKYESSWSFSVYNVYSRANPFYLYFETEGSIEQHNVKMTPLQVALFPIIPAVSYSISF